MGLDTINKYIHYSLENDQSRGCSLRDGLPCVGRSRVTVVDGATLRNGTRYPSVGSWYILARPVTQCVLGLTYTPEWCVSPKGGPPTRCIG